jgi:hypothetical protein
MAMHGAIIFLFWMVDGIEFDISNLRKGPRTFHYEDPKKLVETKRDFSSSLILGGMAPRINVVYLSIPQHN